MSSLVTALGKDVKRSGKDGWIAKCPVHSDKDFAMKIRENASGGYSITCYACGANGVDVYRHMGLDLDELMGSSKDSSFIPQKLKDQYSDDKFFKAIYESDIKKGITPGYYDKKRMKIASARMKGLKDKYGSEIDY